MLWTLVGAISAVLCADLSRRTGRASYGANRCSGCCNCATGGERVGPRLRAALRGESDRGRRGDCARPVRGSPAWRHVQSDVSERDPREKVRYFYLRMMRRAAESGLTRPAPQTPAEFSHHLDPRWPDAEDDVDELTAAFLAARYDRREITDTDARSAQTLLARLMRALKSEVACPGRDTALSDGVHVSLEAEASQARALSLYR